MGDAYPELRREWPTIERWARAEEEGFGRTLAQGERLLAELVDAAREEGTSWVSAEDAFKLHDTFGFPYEMTKELLAEQGLSVDDQGFEELMDRAREVSRARRAREAGNAGARRSRRGAPLHARGRLHHALRGLRDDRGRDGGARRRARERPRCWRSSRRAPSTRRAAARCRTPASWRRHRAARGWWTSTAWATTRRSRSSRSTGRSGPATPCGRRSSATRGSPRCATTPPRTCFTPPCASGSARTCARRAPTSGPDKLRFDFTHGERLSDAELADVEAWIADRIAAAHTVHALETTRDEAEALGAMALFGEKYGDWVRMVEIDGRVARALRRHARGATPPSSGLFHLLSETSSASNVRRIEAVTGRAGAELFRERSGQLRDLAAPPARARAGRGARRRAAERAREGARRRRRPRAADRGAADELAAGAEELGGLKVVVRGRAGARRRGAPGAVRHRAPAAGRLCRGARRGAATAACTWWRTSRPRRWSAALRADAVVRAAAQVVGGGGGGRDTMAQAGGRDPEKLPDALATARLEIERALS